MILMPRPGPRRILVAFKAAKDAVDWIDKRALAEGLVHADGKPHRSEMIRRMLAYASLHMPKGWQPK